MKNLEVLRPSSAQLLAYCAGSHNAQKGIVESELNMEPAERGQRIHAVLEKWLADILGGANDGGADAVDVTDIPPDETVTANVILSRLWWLFKKHGKPEAHGIEAYVSLRGEVDGIDMILWRGRTDLWFIATDGTLHVVDWKTGWGDTPDARISMQARIYFLGVLQSLPENLQKRIVAEGLGYTHIITPRGMTTCRYEAKDVEAAVSEAYVIWCDGNETEARRVPGFWCSGCRALMTGNCPESAGMSKELIVLDSGEMTVEKLSRILDLAAPVKAAIEKAQDAAKALLAANPNAVPNYTLSPGRIMRSVPNVAAAIGALSAEISQAEALECCTLKLGAVEDAVASKLSLKGAAAKNLVSARLAGMIEEKQAASSLKRVK